MLHNKLSLRNGVQLIFALVTLYIGVEFVLFVRHYTSGAQPLVSRPAGVEAFLPISALVSLKAWLSTGQFDKIHPAGLVILLAVLTVSLLFKKAFCSWICPIGTLSEGLARLGRFFFGRNFHIPKPLDYPLRALKYLLLFFFASTVFFSMSSPVAAAFLQSPYNMVADIKMLQFFQNLAGTGLLIVGSLIILSVIFEHFWCRYLCPYGALTGLISILSPWKISRDKTICMNCGACNRACPNRIAVAQASRVWSPECSGCVNCIKACPAHGALKFQAPVAQLSLSPRTLALAVVGVWFAFVILAKLSGHWQTVITPEMYQALIPNAANFSH